MLFVGASISIPITITPGWPGHGIGATLTLQPLLEAGIVMGYGRAYPGSVRHGLWSAFTATSVGHYVQWITYFGLLSHSEMTKPGGDGCAAAIGGVRST